jgi:hypothetical protein
MPIVGQFLIYSQAILAEEKSNDGKASYRIVGKGHKFNLRNTTNLQALELSTSLSVVGGCLGVLDSI